MNKKLFFLFSAFFFSLAPYSFEKISIENMKSLTYDESQWEGCPNNGSWYDYLVWDFNRQQHLPIWQRRHDAFYFVTTFEKTKQQEQLHDEVLDWTTIQDLNLLAGSRTAGDCYLAAKIDRTLTQLGKIMLMHLLIHPIMDVHELRDRQAMVQALLADQKLFTTLRSLFARLAQAEPLAITLWQKQDTFTTSFHNQKIKRFPVGQKIVDYAQKNSALMEIYERASEAQESALLATQLAGTVLLPLYSMALITGVEQGGTEPSSFSKSLESLGISEKAVPLVTFTGMSLFFLNKYWENKNPIAQGASNAAAGAQYGIWSYYNIDSLRSNIFLMYVMQTKLVQVAQFFAAMEQVRTLLSQNPILSQKFKPLRELEQILEVLPRENGEVAKLLELLRSKTFHGDASFFSRWGRVIAAFKLFDLHKEKFVPGLLALGQLDALLSIAALYQEGQERLLSGAGAGWSFPEYQQAAAPAASFKDFWNPFLDPTKVVTNSLALGSDGAPRTALITGSNAGGKSTITKAIVEGLILGQSLGIVPARSCNFTPFAKIMTYLNITDDIAANNSLFKAGVLRAQELLTAAQALRDQQFGFMVLDEVFNGTTYREGQAAAYSLVETLGKQEKLLCTVVTHFSLLTTLEQQAPELFKNYRVSVTRVDGRLRYPFKLEVGVSEQSIALDILKEEGFAAEFVERAHKVLKGT